MHSSCVATQDVWVNRFLGHTGRQWLSDDANDWALEFHAEVRGKKLDGIDLVKLDEDGKICEVWPDH